MAVVTLEIKARQPVADGREFGDVALNSSGIWGMLANMASPLVSRISPGFHA